jgi:hypothetical protein
MQGLEKADKRNKEPATMPAYIFPLFPKFIDF